MSKYTIRRILTFPLYALYVLWAHTEAGFLISVMGVPLGVICLMVWGISSISNNDMSKYADGWYGGAAIFALLISMLLFVPISWIGDKLKVFYNYKTSEEKRQTQRDIDFEPTRQYYVEEKKWREERDKRFNDYLNHPERYNIDPLTSSETSRANKENHE